MKKTPSKEHYNESVKKQLSEKYGYKNVMQIPRLKKISVSMGLAQASQDKKNLESATSDLKLLTAQKPIVTRAKKSISNFKLREEQAIGAKVTLRGDRMYDFFYRFIHVCAPRIPDFRGFKRKADGKGNYSLGLKDQTIFNEIDLDSMSFAQGMNITFVTSAKSDDECIDLLQFMGLPLKSKNK